MNTKHQWFIDDQISSMDMETKQCFKQNNHGTIRINFNMARGQLNQIGKTSIDIHVSPAMLIQTPAKCHNLIS